MMKQLVTRPLFVRAELSLKRREIIHAGVFCSALCGNSSRFTTYSSSYNASELNTQSNTRSNEEEKEEEYQQERFDSTIEEEREDANTMGRSQSHHYRNKRKYAPHHSQPQESTLGYRQTRLSNKSRQAALQQREQKSTTNTYLQRPKSLDIDEVESRLDVEKYFPRTIAHLKSPPESTYATSNAERRMWKDATNEFDADGIRTKSFTEDEKGRNVEHSFFDQGSLDIRGGVHEAVKQRRPSRFGSRVGLPFSHAEQSSPDILQLTGGSIKRDGAAHLSLRSNDAPADPTIEVNDNYEQKKSSSSSNNHHQSRLFNFVNNNTDSDTNSEFGDTPVELTDMLRERLMELKRDKLHEERNETYMPRRLALLTDAELNAKKLENITIKEEKFRTHTNSNKKMESHISKHQEQQLHVKYNTNNDGNSDTLFSSEEELERENVKQGEQSPERKQEKEDMYLARKTENKKAELQRFRKPTLADWSNSNRNSNNDNDNDNDNNNNNNTIRDSEESTLAIHRDGVTFSAARDALKLLSNASSYIPGSSTNLTHDDLWHQANELSNIASEPTMKQSEVNDNSMGGGVYLIRVLPRTGFCSRREAGVIVATGQVRVNNIIERNPFRIVYAQDDVHVSGHQSRLRFAPPRLWMYHKPANVLVSRNDPAGRCLITRHARILGYDHLISIGSLPLRAHGVLLLSNDGELARFLESPHTLVQQTYLLRVRPAVDAMLAHKLNTEGVNINGKQYHNMEFLVNPSAKSRFSLKVKVRGEMMPISHLLQHLGRVIERGGRVSFGPFALGGLAVGSIREVTVPPFYAEHVGHVWKPFIERDWPFFRRQRVARLRRLSRYRELSAKEVEELENFTFDELSETLSFESSEMASVAARRAEEMRRRPCISEAPLESDFLPNYASCSNNTNINNYHINYSSNDIDTNHANGIAAENWMVDEPIVEDITTFG